MNKQDLCLMLRVLNNVLEALNLILRLFLEWK